MYTGVAALTNMSRLTEKVFQNTFEIYYEF
jgi:hypothetical protein